MNNSDHAIDLYIEVQGVYNVFTSFTHHLTIPQSRFVSVLVATIQTKRKEGEK